MKTVVWITTQFVGYHRWKDAPDQVAFLRNEHRHIFHVKLGVRVDHDNRAVEFFMLKEEVNKHLKLHFEGRRFELSCEQIAAKLLSYFSAEFVEVSEDGENGATVTKGDG